MRTSPSRACGAHGACASSLCRTTPRLASWRRRATHSSTRHHLAGAPRLPRAEAPPTLPWNATRPRPPPTRGSESRRVPPPAPQGTLRPATVARPPWRHRREIAPAVGTRALGARPALPCVRYQPSAPGVSRARRRPRDGGSASAAGPPPRRARTSGPAPSLGPWQENLARKPRGELRGIENQATTPDSRRASPASPSLWRGVNFLTVNG